MFPLINADSQKGCVTEMRRKIAWFLTAAVTVLFMVLRVAAVVSPDLTIGSFSLSGSMITLSLVSMAVVALLCFSKSADAIPFENRSCTAIGWIATFCGALLIMSVVLDVFCWAVYGQVPPPNSTILNNVDLYTLIFSLVCGALGGIFLILRGFCWMAQSGGNKTLLDWLSLTPVLWMWFRLARYEISYASTIDIRASFFDFASLVTASLFFLQLSRMLTGLGKPPKNGLLIFSLFTAIASLSGAPLTLYKLSQGYSIGSLLIAIVDAAIGLFALFVAASQVFIKADVTPVENELAWTEPQKEREALDPPFSLEDKLPELEMLLQDDTVAVDTPISITPASDELTVDDILAELNKEL